MRGHLFSATCCKILGSWSVEKRIVRETSHFFRGIVILRFAWAVLTFTRSANFGKIPPSLRPFGERPERDGTERPQKAGGGDREHGVRQGRPLYLCKEC